MIPLHELRIGSLVTHEDYSSEIFEVIEIYKKGDVYFVNTKGGKNGEWVNPIDLINPIPITKEWFPAFGFEFIDNQRPRFGWYFPIKINKCCFLCCGYDNNTVGIEDGEGNEVVSYIPCGSVHQLQILIFSLTGKEPKPGKEMIAAIIKLK